MYCTVFQSVRHYIISLVQLYWPRFKETAPAKTCTRSVIQWLVVSNWHVDSHSGDKCTEICTHVVNDLYDSTDDFKTCFLHGIWGQGCTKIANRSVKWATLDLCALPPLTLAVCNHKHTATETLIWLRSKSISAGCGLPRQLRHLLQLSYQSVAHFCRKYLVWTEQFTAT